MLNKTAGGALEKASQPVLAKKMGSVEAKLPNPPNLGVGQKQTTIQSGGNENGACIRIRIVLFFHR